MSKETSSASAAFEEKIMEIAKDQLLQMLRDRGDYCKAELVEQQLPTKVDPDEHARQLGRIGIVPQEIVGDRPGRVSSK